MESRYLAVDLNTASPEAIVSRLLARAVQSARDARDLPASAERTRRLARALDIIAELRRALDFSHARELAWNLSRLYDFAAERMLRAGTTSSALEIDEALAALTPIAEAFHEIANPASASSAP